MPAPPSTTALSAAPVAAPAGGLVDPDGFYAALIAAHDGLTAAQSRALDARLVLLLADRVGDPAVLAGCLAAARAAMPEADSPSADTLPS